MLNLMLKNSIPSQRLSIIYKDEKTCSVGANFPCA